MNVDGRDIGERKRRRPSGGYVASGSDAVLRTAMSGPDERANRLSLLREAGFDRNLSQVSDYFSPIAAAN